MHDSTTLLVEVGALLLLLGVLGRLSRRVGLSPIPLYLFAGLAFGHGGLLPLAASEEFFAVGAEIGVILLLVMLGLEYSANELVGNLRSAAPAGLIDGVFNALPGAAFALLLGWDWVAALVLGGITWVSSSGVIAKVLADLGRLGNRETPVILSVLVIEDLAMALYLPLVTAVLAGTGLLGGGIALAVAVGTVLLVLVVAIRYGHLISSALSAKDPEALLLGVLGLTLLIAGLAAKLQVSAAVGAFLVGIALSGPVAHHATELLSPCGTCSPLCSSSSSAWSPTHGTSRRCCCRRSRWPWSPWRRRRSPATSRRVGWASRNPADGGPASHSYPEVSSPSSSPGSRWPPGASSRSWRRWPRRTS